MCSAAVPAGGAALDHARYDITITGSSGITGDQLVLQYLDPTDNAPHRLALTGVADSGGAITGYVGPAAGSPLASGASTTTHFQLSVDDNTAPPGPLTVTATLDEIAQGSGNPVLNQTVSSAGTVTIADNQPPPAAPQTGSVAVGGTTTVDLGPDKDADGDTITYQVDPSNPPSLGSATVSGDVLSYTAGSTAGTDTFNYSANDGHPPAVTNTVTITVTAAVPPPVVTHTQTVAVAYATPRQITLGPAHDAAGHPITYAYTSSPAFGTLSAPGPAVITYTPPANKAVATTSFAFTGTDAGGSDTGTVTITIGKARPAIGAVTFSPAHPTSAQVPKATVSVTTRAGSVAGGTVTVTYGSTRRTARVSAGRATVSLRKFTGGSHKLSISFGGTATTSSVRATTSLAVAKVHTTLAVSTHPQQLTTKSKGTLTVKVTATGASINGKTVTLKTGSRVIGTATVRHRIATITLPRLTLGQHNWAVYYPGSTTASAATQSVVLRVALG